MSDWIKVEDRLPDEHQDCLVYYHQPSISFPNLHYMTESSFYNGRFEIPKQVSHWQPLPAPPTE
ncbi:hypothetical protein H097_10452 [Pseudomonas sp. FH4]|uniref:DUF551 domain-containing protein n=1 Tax=Pseudomonas sp. FH4 TaxID=1284393 RepID=UPI0003DD30E4|nr:DUF551 domain-containing protein [Pseudomonas sp. FH4]ETK19273.1 hypothetical protein H097_10452 [Pseudomonas sp. FH4]